MGAPARPLSFVGLQCPACGYDLRGLPRTVCPECGGRFRPHPAILVPRTVPAPAVRWGSAVLSAGASLGSIGACARAAPWLWDRCCGGAFAQSTVMVMVPGLLSVAGVAYLGARSGPLARSICRCLLLVAIVAWAVCCVFLHLPVC